jgi:hypothetical protein
MSLLKRQILELKEELQAKEKESFNYPAIQVCFISALRTPADEWNVTGPYCIPINAGDINDH